MAKRKNPTMNGDELLTTFRRIVEETDDMPTKATLEMTFAAIVDTRRGVMKLNGKVDEVKNEVRCIRENDLPHMNNSIEEIDKRFKENPSLIWLFRYKTNKTVRFCIAILTAIIIIIYIISAVPAIQRIIAAILGLE